MYIRFVANHGGESGSIDNLLDVSARILLLTLTRLLNLRVLATLLAREIRRRCAVVIMH